MVFPFLTKLFNKCYDTSLFPASWCKSVIIPLFKNGNENNPDNYRGIYLLSIASKVFASILNKRLCKWAEKENKISKEQAGFRTGYSTTDHIFTLISMIRKTVHNRRRGKLYVAFIDYKKAFDTVDRDRLWQVLHKLQTSTKMLKLLKSMYASVKSCVRWGSKITTFFLLSSRGQARMSLQPLNFLTLNIRSSRLCQRKR
eukprot:TRINITY_DN27645_c0_g1_i5.p2 TRINITY_DN27645_c0_g1~~TRINITY_DN27645_c0_g1_i5.p2  ORF type:complete len:200 (+),score=0.63 TRINITY_DN27645_c0_g1_i5:33-632(+)